MAAGGMRGAWQKSAVTTPGEEALRDEFSDGERVLFWWRSVRVGQAIALSALVMLIGIYMSAIAVLAFSRVLDWLRHAVFRLRMGRFKRRASSAGCRDGVGSTREACAICLEAHGAGDAVLRLSCGHAFHEPCAMRWVQVSNACPVCKGAGVFEDPGTDVHHKYCAEACTRYARCSCNVPRGDVEDVRELLFSRRLRTLATLLTCTWLFLSWLETAVYAWTSHVIEDAMHMSADVVDFHEWPEGT